MKPRIPAKKYRFMLGTTSRVPGMKGWHYLIIDVDNKTRMKHLFLRGILPEPNVSQETVSGVHIYTNRILRLKQMLHIAVKWYGADRTWARLALKRGWAFLADKGEVKIPWPVERMVIGWRKPCHGCGVSFKPCKSCQYAEATQRHRCPIHETKPRARTSK